MTKQQRAKKIVEARDAISRLSRSMNTAYPRNAVGEIGRNHREAIARWEKTLLDLGETPPARREGAEGTPY